MKTMTQAQRALMEKLVDHLVQADLIQQQLAAEGVDEGRWDAYALFHQLDDLGYDFEQMLEKAEIAA